VSRLEVISFPLSGGRIKETILPRPSTLLLA